MSGEINVFTDAGIDDIHAAVEQTATAALSAIYREDAQSQVLETLVHLVAHMVATRELMDGQASDQAMAALFKEVCTDFQACTGMRSEVVKVQAGKPN